ncbi:MAG: LytTR family DNA-binding domain-containing protein [Candidatus Acidiferrales bacterium]
MRYQSLGYASLVRSGRPIVGISHPLVETKDSDSETVKTGEPKRGISSTSGPEPIPADYSQETVPGRIAITSRRKIVFVDLADVVAVEARCNYVVLRTLSGAHALRQPISAIAEDIGRYGFVRIHRSTIVNGRFVEEIRTLASGKMFVHLKGLGSGYDVSRKYRSALRLFASRWTYGAPA